MTAQRTLTAEAELAQFVHARRRQLALTQPALARRILCHHSAISKWEAPASGVIPTMANARALDQALGSGSHVVTLRIQAGVDAGRIALHRPALPELPALMVGRDASAVWLRQLVEHGTRPVGILAGPAGIGKTTTALTIAHEAERTWPDGALMVRLHGHTPGRVAVSPQQALAEMLTTLTRGDHVPSTIEACRSMLASVLHDRRMLILLDDAYTPAQVRPLLPAADRCAVVITTRHTLSGLTITDGARTHLVPPLTSVQAQDLLGEALAPEPPAVRAAEAEHRIATQCAGVPLAVTAAAAACARHPQGAMGVAQAMDTDRLRLLRWAPAGDACSSMLAGIDRSWRHVSVQAQGVLAAAAAAGTAEGVFEAGMLLRGGGSAAAVEAAIEELVAEHLVAELGDDLYRIPGLVADYAAQHRPDATRC